MGAVIEELFSLWPNWRSYTSISWEQLLSGELFSATGYTNTALLKVLLDNQVLIANTLYCIKEEQLIISNILKDQQKMHKQLLSEIKMSQEINILRDEIPDKTTLSTDILRESRSLPIRIENLDRDREEIIKGTREVSSQPILYLSIGTDEIKKKSKIVIRGDISAPVLWATL